MSPVCLVATCHDPGGRFAPGIESVSGAVAGTFGALAVNATTETHPDTLRALRGIGVPTVVGSHAAGSVGIGTARRDALLLGLESGVDRLFHSDIDHIVRWLDSSPSEVDDCLRESRHDFLVIGRSPAAMAHCPERLRCTEELVNRVYGLANGLDGRWDLMIAMRLMRRDTARTIVTYSRESSIANDVTWPMLVAARGGSVGYVEADGIRFLDRDDFGGQDGRDHDPREWSRRIVTAATHTTAIVEFDPA